MKPLKRPPTNGASLAVSLLLCLLGGGAALAGDNALQDHARRPELLGTQSCSSTSCHGQVEPQPAAASTHGQAYHLWLAHDPHARAGLRIMQPRFQEMLRRTSNRADGGVDPAIYEKCAKCHDPLGASEVMRREVTAMRREGEAPVEPLFAQGIGCESCHGPAEQWIAKHYKRGISRKELGELGMVDTKDVLVRAKLCAACHVGSGENDVTHDMLAAGHPPLRFEMTAHQALIQRKHWDDSLRRQAQPDYEVQLWAAGRIAAADAALSLLERRANDAATDQSRIETDESESVWPELAEYNCFACHQSLRPAGFRLPLGGSNTRPTGVPPWQQWNFACVPSRSPDLATALDRLQTEMERSFAPDPKDIVRLAGEARAVLSSDRRHANSNDVLDALADRRGQFTWERACHELAALTALERNLRDRGQSPVAQSIQPGTYRIAQSLSFTDNRFEWPAVFIDSKARESRSARTMSLDELSAELTLRAGQLRQRYRSTEAGR